MIYQNPIFWGALILVGLAAGYFIRQLISVRKASSVEKKIREQLENARGKAKEIVLDAQNKATDILEEIKKEEREQKSQLSRLEERLLKKEEVLEQERNDLRFQENKIKDDVEKVKSAKIQIEELKQRLGAELENIAKFTEAEAKEKILAIVKEKYNEDLTIALQKLMKERKEEVERQAVQIMTTAIQRMARSHVTEVTTTSFNLG